MIEVIKRNGKKEAINIEKLHEVVEFACYGLTGVSSSEVELKSQLQFYDGMTTKEIQETLIKAAADLISEHTPNYQFVAGRLISYNLRKEVYGAFEPENIYDHVERLIGLGFYDENLFMWYTKQEFELMESWIDHSRDENLTYAAMEQLRGKYLVQK